jgi:diadenosine tetraphosphate (Ap4A) HIT family hydrolase
MEMPNFDKWAVSLWSNHGPKCTNVKEALKQAFEQGYQLGLNQGWAIEQDKDYANKEKNSEGKS